MKSSVNLVPLIPSEARLSRKNILSRTNICRSSNMTMPHIFAIYSENAIYKRVNPDQTTFSESLLVSTLSSSRNISASSGVILFIVTLIVVFLVCFEYSDHIVAGLKSKILHCTYLYLKRICKIAWLLIWWRLYAMIF